MKQFTHFTILLILPFLSTAQTQKPQARPNRIFNIDIHFAVQQPGGDVAKRFGFNNGVGGGFRYKTEKNLVLGVSGSFIFGSRSKDWDILAGISTKEGDIINANGQLVQARLFERGQNYMLHAGKLIPLYKNDKNSGLLLMGGVGWLQHKLRVELPGENTPHLYPEYKRGYDNLHGGLTFSQTIAWQYMEPKKQLINFYIGLEIMEAFTKNLRGYNYHTRQADNAQKHDYFYGLKLCWMIPRYLARKDGSEEFFYK